MAAVRHDHPRSQLCGSIILSKFGIDLVFPAGDITILYNFPSLAGKCLITPPFGFLGVLKPLNIVGRHPNPQKALPWVTTLKSVQGFDLG